MSRTNNEKKVPRKKNFSGIFLVLIFFLFFFITFVTVKEFVNRRQLDRQIAELNSQIALLEAEQSSFLTKIDDYKNDFYVETEARVKLNLQKEGEQVAVVKLEDLNKVREQNELIIKNNNAEISNPAKWWNYFFGEKI